MTRNYYFEERRRLLAMLEEYTLNETYYGKNDVEYLIQDLDRKAEVGFCDERL